MHIVAIAWIYVVLMMAITEPTLVAGCLTFLIYCALPLGVILYLIGSPYRRRKRRAEEGLDGADAPSNPDVKDEV